MSVKTAVLPHAFRFESATRIRRQTLTRAGVTVSLTEGGIEESDGSREARFRIVVAYDGHPEAFESHRRWVYHNDVFLEAGDGTPIPAAESLTLGQQGSTVAMEFRFRDLPADSGPLTLVYVAPTMLVDADVRYELEGVPVSPPTE